MPLVKEVDHTPLFNSPKISWYVWTEHLQQVAPIPGGRPKLQAECECLKIHFKCSFSSKILMWEWVVSVHVCKKSASAAFSWLVVCKTMEVSIAWTLWRWTDTKWCGRLGQFILLLLLYETGYWSGEWEVDWSSSGQCSIAALQLSSVMWSWIVWGVKQQKCDMFKP